MRMIRLSVRFASAAVIAAIAACSDAGVLPSSPNSPSFAKRVAGGGGGGGGGVTAPLLEVSGTWQGYYVPSNSLGTAIPGAELRLLTLHVVQGPSGNLTGSECIFGNCVLDLRGKVDNNGTVTLVFNFTYKGVPTTVACPDGSTALAIASNGAIATDTGFFIYSLNRCP